MEEMFVYQKTAFFSEFLFPEKTERTRLQSDLRFSIRTIFCTLTNGMAEKGDNSIYS